MSDYLSLPENLPRPVDEGAAAHLAGIAMPAVRLIATDGATVDLSRLGPGRTVIYIYPMTGRPGVELPAGWDEIPGARGCTPEACAFRDHYPDLRAAGAAAVYGLSSQDTDYQREAVQRLHLPFMMLSDAELQLASKLKLPTFDTGATTLYQRLTLIVAGGHVEHAFYPVYPPDEHAGRVLAWLRDNNTP